MKSEEIEEGQTVKYFNPNSKWHMKRFVCYKSKYTFDSFRLKDGTDEIIADISEIRKDDHVEPIQTNFSRYSDDMYLERAYGHALNQIGQTHGIFRSADMDGQDEPDTDYRRRIIEELKSRSPYVNPKFQ